jgi:energy-coupling factor transport system permease protein
MAVVEKHEVDGQEGDKGLDLNFAAGSTHVHFDARAWVIWVGVMAALAIMTRNPLYHLILLLLARLVSATCATPDHGFRLPLLRLGAAVLLFSMIFNALSVHIGATVLFRLPPNWPLIGGPVTLEAAVYGAANGLLLVTLLAIFAAFNAIVLTSDLVRLTPRALRDMGLVVLLAVTYTPETIRQLQRIREAQAIRGHRLRGLRDWRPVAIPLLIGGLERAMALAEAMVARGYGATSDVRQPLLVQLGLTAGLAAAFAGWLLTFWFGWPGWLLLAVGVVLILALIWRLGRHTPYTRYHFQPWTKWDTWLVLTAVLPLLVLLAVDRPSYSPYPILSLPTFDPVLGLALLGLALPAFRGVASFAAQGVTGRET